MRRLGAAEIEAILPHRGRMRLIAAAEVDADAAAARSELTPGPDAWSAGFAVPHLFLVEAMAQLAGVAVAAGAGPEAGSADAGARMGYLAEIAEVSMSEPPIPHGVPVRLEARREAAFGTAHLFTVRATADGAVLVEGRLVLAAPAE